MATRQIGLEIKIVNREALSEIDKIVDNLNKKGISIKIDVSKGLEELEKVKNRYESEQIFSNINYLNVATNLAFFELIGRAEDINHEVEKYRAVTANRIKEVAKRTFVRDNCSVLYYKSNVIQSVTK